MKSLDFSYIHNAHPDFIDSIYNDYQVNPESIDQEWRKFFEGFEFALRNGDGPVKKLSPKEFQVLYLINAYRRKGHLEAKTNPIRERKNRNAGLELKDFGLSDKDLQTKFHAGHEIGLGTSTLQDIIDHLRHVYCQSIGAEFMYIIEPEMKSWFRDKLENRDFKLSIEKKKRILEKLNDTVILEQFLHTKYIGQKRFSLEGGESTIPALDAIINKGADLGSEEFVIGMAHRGRLNVLVNILGKRYSEIFSEFEGKIDAGSTMGSGDVKYHLGMASQVKTATGKKVRLKIVSNPSHLEAVNPVVQGYTRAKVETHFEKDYTKITPIQIHGDSSVAGQGIVYEGIQMSQLEGYTTGGAIHIVINNQIGFTTDFDDARSANYCTSVARTVNTPVLHVNGDDVESVIFCVELAAEWRQKFGRDIFIDIVCYRRHGHNEGDDPKFTQPKLYESISKHPNPRDIYMEKLNTEGTVEAELVKAENKKFWNNLQEKLQEIKERPLPYKRQAPEIAWGNFVKSRPGDFETTYPTQLKEKVLNDIISGLIKLPSDFQPLKKVQRMLEQRRKEFFEKGKIDWASGELLAYGSLLLEQHNIRFSGQDVKRGTFSHRHSILFDERDSSEYNRLNHLADKQGEFRIFNSLLSEFAVLGYEYGYSIYNPNDLTIWEAQFGDFVNGAQTVIDQFIASGESKWNQMSGLVMLLPHGFEGQGPEHSSARLERFLQLCAECNMQVMNLTTPANFFHAIRRQFEFPFRKPLIIMSPKSLLRHPECTSVLNDFTNDGFKPIIDDIIDKKQFKSIKRLLLCTGKVYYDLKKHKEENKCTDIAIVRLEQIYPIPELAIEDLKKKYVNAEWCWVQEEPKNMGAGYYVRAALNAPNLKIIARMPGASPATGFASVHKTEQEEIVKKAFEL